MHKVYSLEDPTFVSTLLFPPTVNVEARLMSPSNLARLHRGRARAYADLDEQAIIDAIVRQYPTADITADDIEEAIRQAVADTPFAFEDYPDDFNYLAAALGRSAKYEPWHLEVGGLLITPGVTTIFAETGAGKTTMANLLTFNLLDAFDSADEGRVLRIKLGESGTDVETFLRFSELATALPCDLPPVIILDSVRLQTFDMGGASRSLSISNQLFRWLTEIDVFAVGAGISVILVMNPLGGADDKIADFKADVESSVMSVVTLDDWHSGTFKHRSPMNGRKETQFRLPGSIARDEQTSDALTQGFEAATSYKAATEDLYNAQTSYGRVPTTQI